ncbi:nucleotide pyrophosphohydrolase [Microbacterium sp. NC79]|uniref:nucleotide pyrophosphohydrolase n=1 Tax=Microbacterium sp. NC79 TaxID=2851009 RepID=UPI001C2C10C5|nr:nucleotide pyrophosphohydrolase [Microbacterium sp. NC79]MBV0895949.1 nucleotide pyrophosphohydrolase [Microbacterium sp. NC79]
MVSQHTLDTLRHFAEEREWQQFHSPSNLAKSISIEAAELLELYQWSDEADRQEVADELADVLHYCIALARVMGFDLDEILLSKLEKTRLKYPVEHTRGRIAPIE